MLKRGVEEEIAWGQYVLGNRIEGLTMDMVSDYIHYLGNLRAFSLNFDHYMKDLRQNLNAMKWVSIYSNAITLRPIFLKQILLLCKSSAIEDDL